MTTATAPKQETPDLDALLADVEKRDRELLEQQQRLAPEALVDPGVAAELRDIESQRAATAAERRRIEDARAEGARRVQEAELEAQAKQQAAADRRVARLEPEVLKAEHKIDATAAAFAEAVAARSEMLGQLEQALRDAGRGGSVRYSSSTPLEGALKHALGQAGVWGAIDLPPGPTAPLAPEAK